MTGKPMTARHMIAMAAAAWLLALTGSPLSGIETDADGQPKPLDTRFVRWLERVGPLISEEEREFFVNLPENYRREAFIQAFWKARDPDPGTPLNELQVLWEDRVDAVLSQWGTLEDARTVFYLLNGPPGRFTLPDGRTGSACLSRNPRTGDLVLRRQRPHAAPLRRHLSRGRSQPPIRVLA